MKAVQFSRFGDPEVLEIVDRPDPHPGPGQVAIALRAAGVNASDWKKRQGLMDPDLPHTLGYEAAGVVDELGPGVTINALELGMMHNTIEAAGRAGLPAGGAAAARWLCSQAGDWVTGQVIHLNGGVYNGR